jgi:hypothetical protein
MKKIIIIFLLIIISISDSFAGDRYQLPKTIPTDMGIDAKYYEIASVQLIEINKDSLFIKYVLAIFATVDAKKELGFGQYEIKVPNDMKEDLKKLILPLLLNNFSEE